MHYPTETLSLSNYAAYFLLLFYIPLQHTDCHLVVIVHGLLHWARIPIWRIYVPTVLSEMTSPVLRNSTVIFGAP